MKTILSDIEVILKRGSLIGADRRLRSVSDLLYALREDAGTGFVEFDTEILVNPRDFSFVVEKFSAQLSKVEKFEVISASFQPSDEMASIEVKVDGEIIKSSWKQSDDWVAEEFFEVMKKVQTRLKGNLVELPFDQTYRVLYVKDAEVAASLALLFLELAMTDVE